MFGESSYWLEKVAGIRSWSRDGKRAPHKPLLILYAMAQLQRNGSNQFIPFAVLEQPVDQLLVDFGPPNKTSSAYPFHHLTSDGLWEVRNHDGQGSPGNSAGVLRSSNAEGELNPEFATALLAEPLLFGAIVSLLLERNFPLTVHQDILDQIGLEVSLNSDEIIRDSGSLEKRRRNPEFRRELLTAYRHRCAMCGWDARLDSIDVGLEAAHVRWFNIDGPDNLTNGLLLCVLHHKLLDKGVLGITKDQRVAVSVHFLGGGRLAEDFVLNLAGKEITQPLAQYPNVSEEHILWHQNEVFRSPMLVA